MKVLINTSNISVGGGVQVALSFINELKKITIKNKYYIFLSPEVNRQVNQNDFPKNFYFFLIDRSPASLKTRKYIVKNLDALENKIRPDVVFSIFLPTYWKPEAVHVAGFALGWIINPCSEAYKALNFKQKIKRKIDSIYKIYHVKNNSSYYIAETEDIRDKLNSVVKIPRERIFVAGNTSSAYFDQINYLKFELPPRQKNEFRLITIAHNYPHKNIKIIKEVLGFLEGKALHYKFFVTIDDESYNSVFRGCEEHVINIGSIESKYCPSLYDQCDALFLPTLLESFTASYPEAMKMKKPILTSDLSFAHSLCQNAALYFDPLDPKDIANKIIELSVNIILQKKLVAEGIKQLESFETAKSRTIKYLEICNHIKNNETINTKL